MSSCTPYPTGMWVWVQVLSLLSALIPPKLSAKLAFTSVQQTRAQGLGSFIVWVSYSHSCAALSVWAWQFETGLLGRFRFLFYLGLQSDQLCAIILLLHDLKWKRIQKGQDAYCWQYNINLLRNAELKWQDIAPVFYNKNYVWDSYLQCSIPRCIN